MATTRQKRKERESFGIVARRILDLPQQDSTPRSQKAAAVLVPLFEDNSGVVRVLLTQRTNNLSTHGGEVAFPGGKRDPCDEHDVQTALREANEELGLQQKDITVLKTLSPVLSKHGLSVTPVLATLEMPLQLQPCVGEVQAVFDMPIENFLSSQHHAYEDLELQPNVLSRVHKFDYLGFRVWGLTAGIMIQVSEIALGRRTEFVKHAKNGNSYPYFVPTASFL